MRERVEKAEQEVKEAKASAEIIVKEVQPTVVVDMSQRAELMEAINKLTSDINDVKVHNEELVAQLKANENPSATLDQQANKNFKNLYQALMKSRRMLTLMHDLLATSF